MNNPESHCPGPGLPLARRRSRRCRGGLRPGPATRAAPMIIRGDSEASSSIMIVATVPFEGISRSRCHDYAFRCRLMILPAASRDAARRAWGNPSPVTASEWAASRAGLTVPWHRAQRRVSCFSGRACHADLRAQWPPVRADLHCPVAAGWVKQLASGRARLDVGGGKSEVVSVRLG